MGAVMISDAIVIELIRIIPSLVWFCLIVIILLVFYRPVRDDLLPNLAGLKVAGVELSFVKDSMNAALKLAEKSPQWNVKVSSIDQQRALKRVKGHLNIFKNARMLWIDDHPENNLNERNMFRQLKVEIDMARSTEEALDILKIGKYDIIISDIARNGEATAGLTLLKRLQKEKESQRTPVIFYVGVFEPKRGIPPLAFGITNRPDELLHLTLDALEREKY
jgi:CheY-like chemotaxis protein